MGCSRPTLTLWRTRYAKDGLDGLGDARRSGAPPKLTQARTDEILATTLAPPPESLGVTHWSSRLLAKHLGDVSHVTVSRLIHPDPPWVRWRLGSLDSNRLVGLRLVTVGGLVLGWWDVVEGAVEPDGVEPGHPAEGGELDVVDGLPRALSGAADQLGLVERVDGFGQSVGRSRRLHPM